MSAPAPMLSPTDGDVGAPAPLLSVRDLRKHFTLRGSWPWSKSRGVVKAVDGVSFDLAERETLALVGESGCGKTTTARLLLQLGEPSGGDVDFEGRDIWHLDRVGQRHSLQCTQSTPAGQEHRH
jgi:ABC-type oligopeptide transport system ATPase subunit